MKVILDTHAFLWLAESPNKLSTTALDVCRNRTNTLYLSLVSLWEMQIKSQLGKLRLSLSLQESLYEQQYINHIQLLPITTTHIFALNQLPMNHSDPFDRLLIAQALSEQIAILSVDPLFRLYPVSVVW